MIFELKKNKLKDISYIPISATLAIIIIIVYKFYGSNVKKDNIPCKSTLSNILYRSFIHADFYHIFFNLYMLYIISRIEKQYGSINFLKLILFLLLTTTIIEYVIDHIYHLTCSIGFSGILFGLFTYELIMNTKDYKIDISLLFLIITNVVLNSLRLKTSIIGHSIGAFSGILATFFIKIKS